MMLIFALGAVFGAMLGAFSLALITACTDYTDAQRRRRELPVPEIRDGERERRPR